MLTAEPRTRPAGPVERPSARPAPRRAAPRLRYVPGIDGLRALAVIAVLLYHADVTGVPGGFLGVEVFLVISGYLITSLLLAEHRSQHRVDLKQFWLRRARRLLPALGLLLAVVSAYALLFLPDSVARLRGDVLAALGYVSNWWQIARNDSYFVEIGRPPLLRHLWSLAVEEQFYLFWPIVFAFVMARFSRRHVRMGVLVAALASSALMALLYHPYSDPSRVYYGTDTRASGLLLGVVLAYMWSPQRLGGRPGRGAGFVMDGIGVIGLLVLAWSFTRVNEFDPFVYRGGFLVVGVGTALLIAATVHPASHVGRLLGWRPLVAVGLVSYGLYLWHWPIFAVTRPDLDVPLSGFPLLVLRLALTGAFAYASYRFVEQPVRHGALRRTVHRWRAAPEPVRSRIARRIAFTGGALVVLTVVLAAGLIGAESAPPRIPGISEAAVRAAGGDPAAPTAPTASTAPATATTIAPGTAGPAPVPLPGLSVGVTGVGDSVMLGAAPALQRTVQGIRVDAKVSRQFGDAASVIAWYRDQGLLGGVVVVHLGTNGAFGDGQFDDVMRAAGDRRVLWVNAAVPRPWEGLVNERVAAGVARWPNARLVDWHATAAGHPEYFVSDGVHLTSAGQQVYADLILRAVGS